MDLPPSPSCLDDGLCPLCIPFSFYLCSIHAGQLSCSHSVFVFSQGWLPSFPNLGTFCRYFLSRLIYVVSKSKWQSAARLPSYDCAAVCRLWCTSSLELLYLGLNKIVLWALSVGEEELRLHLLDVTWLLWYFWNDLFVVFLLLLPPSLNAQHVAVGWESISCWIVIWASERDIFGSQIWLAECLYWMQEGEVKQAPAQPGPARSVGALGEGKIANVSWYSAEGICFGRLT